MSLVKNPLGKSKSKSPVVKTCFLHIYADPVKLVPPLWTQIEAQIGAGMEISSKLLLFIGPESDHWLCLSLTHSLTN